MTNEQTDESSRTEWLPPVSVPLGDDGLWRVIAHWARVDGRPMIVGVDVRSFHESRAEGATVPDPLGPALDEVDQRTLRGVSIKQLREEGRSHLKVALEVTAMLNAQGEDGRRRTVGGRDPAEALSWLTAEGAPRKRRPPATHDLLRQVAALYEEAVSLGDKAPAKYVETRLREAGEPRLSTDGGDVLVRQWLKRARDYGYLELGKKPKRRGI